MARREQFRRVFCARDAKVIEPITPARTQPMITFLTTDYEFTTAELEYNRLIGLSVASSDPDEQSALRFQANAQLFNMLNSIPVSRKSAACVARIIQEQVTSSATPDVITGLKLINSFLTQPYA